MRQYQSLTGIVIIFLFISCHQHPAKAKGTPAQTASRKLSVADMRTDMMVLWSAVKQLHPGYGIYCSPDSIEQSYNAVFSAIDDPMYEGAFITRIYPFLCTLGCGHTQLKASSGYQPPAGVRTSHLPFEAR